MLVFRDRRPVVERPLIIKLVNVPFADGLLYNLPTEFPKLIPLSFVSVNYFLNKRSCARYVCLICCGFELGIMGRTLLCPSV